jgi:hypothetical protein
MANEITTLENDFIFTSNTVERIPAPVNKMLKFHTLPFEKTTRINSFKTLPNGDPNPKFGQEEAVLIFKAMLDETDAKGQWYSAWVSTAISDRSNLGKISEALFGTYDGIKGKAAAELVDLPFQCSLTTYTTKTGEERQALNLDKIMPAADGQTVPELDPTEEISMEDFDKAIAGIK